MERKNFASAPCPIARSLDLVGDWWTPLIMRECLYGVHRFDEIQRWIGISRNILSRRLTKLVEQAILEKRVYQKSPTRHEYHLTAKGYDAALLLLLMVPFGDRWLFPRGHEPVELFDRSSGRRVRPVVVDGNTGKRLDARALFAGPGRGFPRSRSVRRERFAEYFSRSDGNG